jgi:hypothetical protein
MEAFKHITVPLLTFAFVLALTGCVTAKKNSPKGMLYKQVHSHHSKSKLRYKI